MKVEFEIGDLKCKASTDIGPDITTNTSMSNALKSAIFSRLCNEARAIALKMIEEKYGKGSRRS